MRSSTAAELYEEDLEFRHAEYVLRGTLTVPREVPPGGCAGAILVHGSGVTDRDWTQPIMDLEYRDGTFKPVGVPSKEWAIKPAMNLAHALAAGGVVVLRYDKRGYRESGAEKPNWTLDLHCGDAAAAVQALRSRAEVGGRTIFLVGHSEGGIVVQKVAADSEAAVGLVLLASPFTPLFELTFQQTRYCLEQVGWSEAEIERALSENRETQRAVLEGRYPHERCGGILTEHMRSVMLHDVPSTLARIAPQTPVLILNGDKDWQIPPSEARATQAALLEAGVRDVELHILEHIDHLMLLQPGTSRIETYLSERRQVPAAVLQPLCEWARRKSAPP